VRLRAERFGKKINEGGAHLIGKRPRMRAEEI